MKITIKNKLQALAHFATFKKSTPITVRAIGKEFKLGYTSLLIQVLEAEKIIKVDRSGRSLSLKWISEEGPSEKMCIMIHEKMKVILKGNSEKNKIKESPGGFKVAPKFTLGHVMDKEAFLKTNISDLIPEEQKEKIKDNMKNKDPEQLFLNLDDISSEEQKKKQQLQLMKIKLLTELNSIQASFSKKIKELSKEIANISLIMLISLFCFSCSEKIEQDLLEVESVSIPDTIIYENASGELDTIIYIYDSASDTISGRSDTISNIIPEGSLEKWKEYEAILAGEVDTDILSPIVYAEKYFTLANIEEELYDIPSSVTLAQGILESSSGKSKLATENKNHFGVKCFSRTCKKGHCSNFNDDSHKDFFRIYKTVAESYRDHSKKLQSKRYKPLKSCKNNSEYCYTLKSCGYATSPTYSQKLIRIIKKYDLEKYDLK